MADEPHLPRFLVRRGARRGWMVWDRQTKGPANTLVIRPWNCQKTEREKLQTNSQRDTSRKGDRRRAVAPPVRYLRPEATER
jgi:hypothetical protein